MGNLSTKQVYIDQGGITQAFDKSFVHLPQEEFFFVSAHDVSIFHKEMEVEGGDECYLMSVYWLNSWTRYAKSVGDKVEVGSINNMHLVDDTTKTLKISVKYKMHFKIVSKAVWEYFFRAYGGGPVIGFHGNKSCFVIDQYVTSCLVPLGLDDNSYKTGKLTFL
jgi:hypothetical protein